jgi:hypothetical protein
LSLDYLSIALNLDVLFRCASTDSEHYRRFFGLIELANGFGDRA